MSLNNDEYWIRQAIALASKAQAQGEVPVGALLVKNDQILAQGYNQPISSSDPTAHAEIVVMRNAAQMLNNYRLVDTTLYVTLEPCMMCAGAIVHARIGRLVYGAFDPRTGVVSTCAKLLDEPYLNHRVDYIGGVLADECAGLLKDFFRQRRSR